MDTPRVSRRTSLLVGLVALIATTGQPSAVAVSAPQAVPLLTRPLAVAVPRGAQTPSELWERRSRVVAFNAAALSSRGEPGTMPDGSGQIAIELFDGRTITAVFERFDANTSGVTWVGTVPDLPHSRVTLVSGGGLLAASIMLSDASYTILPQSIASLDAAPAPSSVVHVLTELNQNGFAPEAPPLLAEVEQAVADRAAEAVMTDTADFVDLLVVYTAAAELWAGGPVGMLNLVNLAVSQANSGLSSSGVFTQLWLSHAARVNYSEVDNFNTNLTNLRGGVVPDVLAMREAYSADLVAMIVRPVSPSACGIAFLMTAVTTAFAPNGFSVTDAPCIGQATFAHELGHNMGLRHDWFMDAGITPFSYAHGYVNVPGRFRTIMAYPDHCSALGLLCPRIVAFSNPEQTQLGQPRGVAGGTSIACQAGNTNNPPCDADERRALNDTALTVANFRQFSTLRPPRIVSHPASQSVPRGQVVTLQVAADGLGPFSFQWYRGASPSTASPIPGATSGSYAFVPGADGVWFERWFYWARVTNSIGAADSLTATLTLLQPGEAPSAGRRAPLPRGRGVQETRLSPKIATPTGKALPPQAPPASPRHAPQLASVSSNAGPIAIKPCATDVDIDPEWLGVLASVAEQSWRPATAARLLTWLILQVVRQDEQVVRQDELNCVVGAGEAGRGR